MAFDERLADRIRKRLGKRDGVSEKKMFGGRPHPLEDVGQWIQNGRGPEPA